MKDEKPLLSIVIANFNYGRFLSDAIESVLSQGMGDCVELIVCDAGSTDDSVSIIRRYAQGLPQKTYRPVRAETGSISWWCSEKDNGQSDAFNKGFAHARGRFLTWLNADDVFLPGALRKLSDAVERNSLAEWFVAGSCRVDKKLNVITCVRSRPLSRIRAEAGEIQTYGPSSFFSRSLFDRAGGFVDERFHYMMDIELWCRFYQKCGATYERLPDYVWGFRVHEESKTSCFLVDGEKAKRQDCESRPKRDAEFKLNASMYCRHRFTPVRRLLSVAWIPYVLGKIDTFRYKGLYFSKV